MVEGNPFVQPVRFIDESKHAERIARRTALGLPIFDPPIVIVLQDNRIGYSLNLDPDQKKEFEVLAQKAGIPFLDYTFRYLKSRLIAARAGLIPLAQSPDQTHDKIVDENR